MTKITHSAFAQPPRSWLRKMSMKTVIRIQIQMKNKKNQIIDQSTWPTLHSASTMRLNSSVVDAPGSRRGSSA